MLVHSLSLFHGGSNLFNRINEFNETTLALFLPYHESPHFAKMVSISHIQYVIAFFFFTLLLVNYFL